MKKFSLFSLLLSGSFLSLFGQQLDLASSKGMTSFYPLSAIEFPDSVVKFEYANDPSVPNISKTIYYYNADRQLDSVLEIFQDNHLNYSSGHSTVFSYDGNDRISGARKVSWNSHLKDLVITIEEEYEYTDESDYVKYSHITWNIASHSSSVLVGEQYHYDEENLLASYIMNVPPEINPDSVTYQEAYQYDSIGILVHEKKDLCIKEESIQHSEKEHHVQYNSEILPSIIYTSERKEDEILWNEVGQVEFFYDDSSRDTMRIERQMDDSLKIFKTLFTYDTDGHLVREMSYAADASDDYSLVDSTVYYYSALTKINKTTFSENDLRIFPNPSSGWIHVQCGEDFPATLRIFDVTGKAVYTIERVLGLANIDLTNQPPGIYFVRLRSSLGLRTGKMLKY